ncbi:unnamed protein product [Rotaria magnacalcarata]|nr:unnamed protein product [Rotaria magnacalcarata]
MSKQFQYSEPVAAITKSTSTNMFKCDECNFETRAKQALHKHKDKHGRNKNSLLSSRHQSLSQPVHKPKQTHIQQSENKDDFSCSECIFKGKTLLGFLKHKKSHHGKNLQEYPYNCVYCHYRATKKSHLRRHEMIHTGERPYECPHCDYRCNQASTLKVHIRRHTGEMPYSCSVCPFKTFSTCLLKAHLKKHVIPKGTGFTCHICHQIYNTELALKKHEQMHSQPNLLVRRRRRMKQTQNEVKNKKKETLVDPVLSPIIKQELPETASYSPPLTGLYQCSLCDFQCNKFVQLSEHTMNHRNGTFEAEDVTPRKKYFCVECNLHFARKKEIKSHYKITHPGENYQKNR